MKQDQPARGLLRRTRLVWQVLALLFSVLTCGSSVAQETPATPTANGPASLTLRVWWPDALHNTENTLPQQLVTFEATHPNLTVEGRVKKALGTGGMLETLLAASAVALGSLPDLALVSRQDLPVLVSANLVRPLDEALPSTLLVDMPSVVQTVGQVDAAFYGLPYAVDVLHTAYLPPAIDFTSFETFLAAPRPLSFAIGGQGNLSDPVLAQYLAAGGTLENGSLIVINPEALLTVLSFYEQARTTALDPNVLKLLTTLDYQAGLLNGLVPAGVVTSTQYLGLKQAQPQITYAHLPTADGSDITLLDGWVWVILARTAEQQRLAFELLRWLMEEEQQAPYSAALAVLPSRLGALRSAFAADYVAFVEELLTNAVLRPTVGTSAARAAQTALVNVLSGSQSAASAVDSALQQAVGSG